MRKVFALLLVVAPLIAGCGKVEEPLIPELKGRWSMPNFIKADAAARAERVSMPSPPATTDHCRVMYVTFSKRGIVMHTLGPPLDLFNATSVKREGQRLTLTGTADSGKRTPESDGKLVLLLRNNEVRFDDVFDESGRSLKYEGLPADHQSRRMGATTIGEMLDLFLTVKPCQA